MSKPTISLAIIVKDSEATLDRCLSSFAPVVDEIIVVDTGSKDKSVEIAGKYTDKVYFFDWIDDFSAARNYSFDMCTGDFILWCDSDDDLVPEQAVKLKALDLSDKDIVICNYQYAHDEFGACSLPVPTVRIVRRSLGLRWQKRIHEYLPMNGVKQFISDLDLPYHRKQAGSSERNLAILERVVAEDPSDPRDIYYLGKELYDFGRLDGAIGWLEKFVTMPGSFWEDVFHAHDKLALAKLQKGDEAGFKHHIFESLKLEERRAEPMYHMAFFYHCRNQWDKAIQWYEMSTRVKRPKELLSSYQPEYYSWLPFLQLCVCYNSIGDIQKAYDFNKKVLEVRPKDTRAVNNEKILGSALERKAKEAVPRKDGKGVKLHLGCGNKRLEGYVNADIFKGPAVDEVFPLDDIPYADGTVSEILTEHVLEHLTFDGAEKALQEWFRVLAPGGRVDLSMPDLESCFRRYLEAPLEDSVFMRTRAWYKATVYGIQKSQAGEPAEAQIHRCGFSKEEIRIVLGRHGFVVEAVENYGGPGQKPDYGTPSMRAVAAKPCAVGSLAAVGGALRVAWIGSPNMEAAQTRIRVHRIDDWLKSEGHQSKITGYDEAAGVHCFSYDTVIVGKAFDEVNYKEILKLKQAGKRVYADFCEQITEFPWVKEILSICDRVICCSRELEKIVQLINPRTAVIEDAYEQ